MGCAAASAASATSNKEGLDGRVLRHQKRSLALSGRTATELRGQQLVLTDEDGGMTIAGDPAHLRWIAERVAEIQPRGDASDVPQELRQVADAVRAERSGVRG